MVAAVAVASIAAILITVRALVGSRLLFIAYCVTVFALVGLVLSTCDLEHVCKGSIVAFDRGEDWLSFSNGLGEGPVGAYGTVFLLGSLIGARWLVQRSKAHALFESLNQFFFNWRRVIVAISIIVALGGFALNIWILDFVLNERGYIDKRTSIIYVMTSTPTLIMLLVALKKPVFWKYVFVGVMVTIAVVAASVVYRSYLQCSDYKQRAGYEITYQERCGWHQDIFGSM